MSVMKITLLFLLNDKHHKGYLYSNKHKTMLNYTEIITSLLTATTTLGGIWLTNFLKPKGEDKVSSHLMKKQDTLDKLSTLQQTLHSDRVNLWYFSNGTQYYTGGHLQNLSCFAEVNTPGFDSLEMQFQRIPIQFFERLLFKLTQSEVIVADERNEQDDLGIIHRQYGVKFIVCTKVISKGKWVGVLCASYSTLPPDIDTIKVKLRLEASKFTN